MRLPTILIALLGASALSAADCFSTKECVIPEKDQAGVVEHEEGKDLVPGQKIGQRWRCTERRLALDASGKDVGVYAGSKCGDKQWYDPAEMEGPRWKPMGDCGPSGAGEPCPKPKV